MKMMFYRLSTYNYLQYSSESGEISIFHNIQKCSIFRSVLLKIEKRPQTNFDLQIFIVSCFQPEDIRNVMKPPTFFCYLARKMFTIKLFPIFVKLLKHAIIIRRFLGMWMHDNKTTHLHLGAGVLTCRKWNYFYFLSNTYHIFYVQCMHILVIFLCPNSTKIAKSPDPFPWQPGLKVTDLIPVLTFCTKRHILCKFHQNLSLSISTYIGNSYVLTEKPF